MGRMTCHTCLPGRRTIAQYNTGWISATIFFGWGTSTSSACCPSYWVSTAAFCRQGDARVVEAAEVVLKVHRLAYTHRNDTATCFE